MTHAQLIMLTLDRTGAHSRRYATRTELSKAVRKWTDLAELTGGDEYVIAAHLKVFAWGDRFTQALFAPMVDGYVKGRRRGNAYEFTLTEHGREHVAIFLSE